MYLISIQFSIESHDFCVNESYGAFLLLVVFFGANRIFRANIATQFCCDFVFSEDRKQTLRRASTKRLSFYFWTLHLRASIRQTVPDAFPVWEMGVCPFSSQYTQHLDGSSGFLR